jgi:hypothetical protein
MSGPLQDGFSFTTVDRTGPELTAVDPPPNTAIHPVTGPDLQLSFSEAVMQTLSAAPILKLSYGSGNAPPLLDSRDAVSLGDGRWRLAGEGWLTDRQVRLRVLPIPDDADGNRYRPGDQLFLTLESASDKVGNSLQLTNANPWSLAIQETRLSELEAIFPDEGARAALDAPVIVRFSHRMDPSSLQFEADGDWTPYATEIFKGAARYSPRRWITNSWIWDAGQQEAEIHHAPFEESLTDDGVIHTFRILAAHDAQFHPYVLPDGQSALRTWTTGRRPRVTTMEALMPADPQRDLTVAGLLSDPNDLQRVVWKELPQPGPPDLPLNTRLRVHFSSPMNGLTLGSPLVTGANLTATLTPQDATTALVTFNGLLPSLNGRLARSPDGGLQFAPPISLSFTVGRNVTGDPLIPFQAGLAPLDLQPPAFRVEYLANPGPDDSVPALPDWRPLNSATVPASAPWRVVANEALSSNGITLDGVGDGPDPTTRFRLSERKDADGLVGNALEIHWSRPLTDSYRTASGEDVLAASVRIVASDLRTLPEPNVSEQTLSFKIALPPLPDLDHDGDFNVADLASLLHAVLLGEDLSDADRHTADVAPPGGDGQVKMNDINRLLRLLLGY